MIDPTFRNINILFALSFKNGDNYPARTPFDKHYTPLVEVKDFNTVTLISLRRGQRWKLTPGIFSFITF